MVVPSLFPWGWHPSAEVRVMSAVSSSLESRAHSFERHSMGANGDCLRSLLQVRGPGDAISAVNHDGYDFPVPQRCTHALSMSTQDKRNT